LGCKLHKSAFEPAGEAILLPRFRSPWGGEGRGRKGLEIERERREGRKRRVGVGRDGKGDGAEGGERTGKA